MEPGDGEEVKLFQEPYFGVSILQPSAEPISTDTISSGGGNQNVPDCAAGRFLTDWRGCVAKFLN